MAKGKAGCIAKAVAFVGGGLAVDYALGQSWGLLQGLFSGAEEAAPPPAKPQPASTVSHQIKHTSLIAALAGAVIGALVTAALTAVVIGAAALLVTVTAGAALLIGVGVALAAGSLISKITSGVTGMVDGLFPAEDGPVLHGSPNVWINGLSAARAGLDTVGCIKHGTPSLVAEGSATVIINEYPAARIDDKTACGGTLKQGEKTVVFGGAKLPMVEIENEFTYAERALLIAVEFLVPPSNMGKGLAKLPGALVKGAKGLAKLAQKAPAFVKGLTKSTNLAADAFNAVKNGIKSAGKSIMAGICPDDKGKDRTDSGNKDGDAPPQKQCEAGCPIDTSTGAVVEERHDFEIGSSFPFRMIRSYHGQRPGAGLLGRGWSDSLGEHLTLAFEGDLVTLYTADGYTVPFDIASDKLRVFNRRYPYFTLIRKTRGFDVHDRRDDTTRRFEIVGERGRLAGVHDAHGNGVVLGYVGDRLSWVRHSDGPTLGVRFLQEPNDDREVIVIERMDVGAPTLVARYTSRRGLLLDAEVIVGHHLSYEYDRYGRMSRWTDNHKTWAKYEYDDAGRCVRSRAADGLYSVDLSYDERSRTTLVRNGRGSITEYRFDERRKLVRKIDPLGGEEIWKYDRHGQQTAYIDPLGNAEQDVYDPVSGVLVRRYDREGKATELFYDDDLRVIAVIDALGKPWVYERGRVGEITRVEAPDGSTFAYGYTPRGQLAEVKRSDGATRTLTYDGRNRLVAETDWAGNVHRYEYDVRDRLVVATDAGGHREALFYDPRDLLVMVRHGDQSEVRLEHDHERLLTAVMDENGHVARREYGAFDLQRSATDAEGRRYELTYDADHLEVVGLKAPDGRRYRLERDAAGRVEREIDYGGRVTEYQRDAAGNVVERTNAAGERTSYAYDKNGRLIEVEGDGETTTYEYDALGRLVLAEGSSGRLEWEYDAVGRVMRCVQNEEVLEYRYDAAGRRIERELKPGPWQKAPHHTKYAHDENGRLRALELEGERLELERDARGSSIRVRARDGYVLEQAYDERGYLAEQRVAAVDAGGGAGVEMLHRSYAYDPARNLVEVDDSHWGVTRYGHDRSDRIVAAVRAGGGDEAFAYDANGLLARTRLRTSTEDRIAGIELGERGLPCRLGDDEYDFDEVGRLVAKTVHRKGFRPRTWMFRWNHQDQLVEARTPEGEIWRYAYDPLGRRVLKYNPSTKESVHFLWDGDVLLRELHLVSKTPGGMEQVARVVYWHHEPGTFRPIARETDGEAQLVVSDGIGTPVAMVATGGEIAWRGQRTVWGAELRQVRRRVGDESAVGFPGQYRDEETGLFYNRFRYYDAGLGGYVGPDPIGLGGGGQPWAYVHDPTRWIDPLGLVKVCTDATTQPEFPGFDPTKPPPGFEWRGKPGSVPGSKDGNFYNSETGESLRPDLDHPEPIGPHWDYRDPNEKWWRIKPDGSAEPKKT